MSTTMDTFFCAHCGAVCSPQIHLFTHIASERVCVLTSPFFFCSDEHRMAWYDTPTTEDLIRVVRSPEACLAEARANLDAIGLKDVQLEDARAAVEEQLRREAPCRACVDGEVPVPDPDGAVQIRIGGVSIVAAEAELREEQRCARCGGTGYDLAAAGERGRLAVTALADIDEAESNLLHEDDSALRVSVIHDGRRYEDGKIDAVAVRQGDQDPTILPGVLQEQHLLQTPADVLAWWRGDIESAPVEPPRSGS